MSQEIVVAGLDLAKNVFKVHAIDAQVQPAVRCQPRHAKVLKFFAKLPPCLVGMEAFSSITIGAASWVHSVSRYG